jgi:hypothetical protein
LSKIVPKQKPRLSSTELHDILAPYNIDRKKYPVVVVGIRGYYMDTMGVPRKNDRGIYDDAIFIDAPNVTAAFNANTDPSVFKPGIAVLKPGLYFVHKIDLHRGLYPALCQRAGVVTVIRDGNPPVEATGYFGINIHKGGKNVTSSLGCQTIFPDQWPSFFNLVIDSLKRVFGKKYESVVVPYCLIDNGGK